MKKNWKRLIAMVLVLGMLLSMQSVGSLAAGFDRIDWDSAGTVHREKGEVDAQAPAPDAVITPVEPGAGDDKPEETKAPDVPEEAPVYPAAVLEGTAAGKAPVSVRVEAPEGALPAGTEMTVAPVSVEKVQAAVDASDTVNGIVQAAADITFTFKGGEIQPAKPITVYMSSAALSEAEALSVVHLDAKAESLSSATPVESVDADAQQGAVSFDAEKFSVYAVIADGQTGSDARATVKFFGKDKTEPVATFYVKNSDELLGSGERDPQKSYIEDIVYDPGAGRLEAGEIFRGWVIGTPDYTRETETHDIAYIRQYLADLSIKEGDVVNIYAVIFRTITVSYLGEKDIALGSETLTLLADEASAPYTVNMAYTPSSSYQSFEGWKASKGGTNIQGHTTGKIYPNGTQITLTGDVTFSVEAPLGHWLVFDEVETGATYNAPQFVKDGEVTVEPTTEMYLLGHTFDGWYADADYTTPFTFGQKLTDNQTVYAKWTARTSAPYIVLIWKQNVHDAKDAADSAKTYDFAESVQLSGTVGQTVRTVTASGTGDGRYATVNGAAKRYTGFHLNRYDQNVTIDAKGNTVVNVYYDRNLITLDFVYRDWGRWALQERMTGLYGSRLEDNGYTWPEDYSWDYTDGSETITMTFMDAFIPPEGGSSVTFRRYSPSGSYRIYFLKQDPADPTRYTVENRVYASGYSNFYITDKYNGYKASAYSRSENGPFTALGEKDKNGRYATISMDYEDLYILYDPLKYNILFMDGVYVDGDGNPVSGYPNRGQLNEVKDVHFESDVSAYNQGGSKYYAPTFDGFAFAGWYVDSACTHPYRFTTMPEGIKVYAKWIRVQYRVFLHPNAGTDTTLDWGSDTQKMNFRLDLGDKVSTPTGLRKEYEMVGWYLDEDFTKIFNKDAFILNDTTVTTPYDKTVDMTDPMDKWGNGATTNADTDRFWITRKLDLYAKWRAVLIGAKGIGVQYDAGEGTNAPSDTSLYKDQAGAVALSASTAPEKKQFLYWVVQTWDEEKNAYVDTNVFVYPGDSFTVLKDNAKVVEKPESTEEKPSFTYTVQLRAEYGDREVAKDTYINWYRNWADTDTAAKGLLHHDEKLQINEAVQIYTLTSSVPTRPGFKFLGWAREEEFKTDAEGRPVGEAIAYHSVGEKDLFLKWTGDHYEAKDGTGTWTETTRVAADERLPYHALYAVWESNVFYIYHSLTGKLEAVEMPEAGKTFDLTAKVSRGGLYGGYYKTSGAVTAETVGVAKTAAASAEDLQADVAGAAIYDGKSLKNGTVRFWTKTEAYKEAGDKMTPVKDTVYYLKEVPALYLETNAKWVYNWAADNKIEKMYYLTVVDDTYYSKVGYTVIAEDKKASLVSTFSYQKRNDDSVTKVTPTNLVGQRGYIGVVNATANIADILAATEEKPVMVVPFWITLDGVRVQTAGCRMWSDGGDVLTTANLKYKAN